MSIAAKRALFAIAFVASLGVSNSTHAQEKTVKIYGFGAKSGVVGIFGQQSEAAMQAAAAIINKSGGVTLGDGSKARLVIDYLDDRCTAEEGINALRRIASQNDAFVAIGPTCSNVAEPVFGILQKKTGDASDSGIQFPLYTDVAAKGGLASISQWAFRNVPSEANMYKAIFEWIKATKPELKTFWGGVEKDFAHSNATFGVIKAQAGSNGLQVLGQSEWLLNDTNFSTQVREMRRANADVVAISAHPFTTCGVLKEMARQNVRPKLLVGLTSSSSMETLQGCAAQAEGLIIPTSFAPVTDQAKQAAVAVQAINPKYNMDLHNAAAFENVFTLKELIEKNKIMARPDSIQADRVKMRDALAAMKETQGLLGKVGRTDDREAIKPYLFVQAKSGNWVVAHTPKQ
ncbi:MAG: ABC transporter substrate-binding protein [Betaproteobacteria bacterium]|nr:ABC transporter substrate-binding protein [Betaproteobacteria bacterium]NBQ78465.1 ABC transporter substrate-binding protein [Betaproteobacteria bacterium]NBQ95094.1 ABC transporter substrate-binding protein [Betaproteobacteria bacterium]NBS39213.1 ABC transporter substrate-binding protein [Betaproteobacteria bacterium]NBT71691.1 ABC transporter substrate-binding protein [Betaproteobacteria bacterium]